MSPTRVTVTLSALALLLPRSFSSCRLLIAVAVPLLPLIVYTKFDPPPTPGSSRPCPTQYENSRDDINRTVIKVVDGLLSASGDALLGVTSAATMALTLRSFLSGLSTVFSTVAAHNLINGVYHPGGCRACWRTAVTSLVWPHTNWPTTKISTNEKAKKRLQALRVKEVQPKLQNQQRVEKGSTNPMEEHGHCSPLLPHLSSSLPAPSIQPSMAGNPLLKGKDKATNNSKGANGTENGTYVRMQKLQEQRGLTIGRIVRETMLLNDPDGVDTRYPGRKRAQLKAHGTWQEIHCDGHEKLGALAIQMGGVGLPIYGMKDKWGNFIEEYRAIPQQIKVDKGSETGHIYAIMTGLKTAHAPGIDLGCYPSFVAPKNTNNTPIESLWHWFQDQCGKNLYLQVTKGRDEGIFNPNNSIHMYELLFRLTATNPDFCSIGCGHQSFRASSTTLPKCGTRMLFVGSATS
ncbi:hypothetical protein DFH09DRAFT_1105279 [Mycena vulgaris]|nr:hypothetical protein DFH09DRAFT_1105279 [Mycena vulgaris]